MWSAELIRRREYRNAYNLRPPHYIPSFVHGTDATPAHLGPQLSTGTLRNISSGFWTVGGRASVQTGQLPGVLSASGSLLVSGATAPLHSANFMRPPTPGDCVIDHGRRIALALEIDRANRILHPPSIEDTNSTKFPPDRNKYVWKDSTWMRESLVQFSLTTPESKTRREKAVPTVPFRVLDAPNLKDDYYCSILAYNPTCHTLAVALTQKVYLWTEQYGVRYPPLPPARSSNFVTSLAFSSEEGGKAILAVARNNGAVTLWSLLESQPRFEPHHPCPASCVSFKPTVTWRESTFSDSLVACEDLLVGDDIGKIYYYSIEWLENGQGLMTLLAKLDAHSQNVCGLAWSPDGLTFVSGGNDNRALLFDAGVVLQAQATMEFFANNPAGPVGSNHPLGPPGLPTPEASPDRGRRPGNQERMQHTTDVAHTQLEPLPTPPPTPSRGRRLDRTPHVSGGYHQLHVPSWNPNVHSQRDDFAIPGVLLSLADVHVYSFYHAAAVKAIAFAPWQPTLLATGGGSNDRQIHFFHAGSGATLALINVFSQVTSLVWSTTRREIVATFGYSQPEHEIRIAVFSWPSCECVVSIP
ncbi:hypothetical protein LTR84_009055 [Exophiala bonariae]|uniref:Anaphase-promoting complex subunit 4 WD40 domain-containing protein n=1 Tax=Exophiala bonariae TaxID=1690606 RepID=A0AAV9MVZ3_9EURO|nr:hypothetical protein LTR84_009055 [Exophiala bonariae]